MIHCCDKFSIQAINSRFHTLMRMRVQISFFCLKLKCYRKNIKAYVIYIKKAFHARHQKLRSMISVCFRLIFEILLHAESLQ